MKVKSKRKMDPNVLAKGKEALAKYREEQRKLKALPEGPEKQALIEAARVKAAQKKLSPLGAIKNFCNACVATRQDITNCTAKQCSLYIYRPYQQGSEE